MDTSFVVALIGSCPEEHTDKSGPAADTAAFQAASSGTVEGCRPAGHTPVVLLEVQFAHMSLVRPAEAGNSSLPAAEAEESEPEAQRLQETRLADPAG